MSRFRSAGSVDDTGSAPLILQVLACLRAAGKSPGLRISSFINATPLESVSDSIASLHVLFDEHYHSPLPSIPQCCFYSLLDGSCIVLTRLPTSQNLLCQPFSNPGDGASDRLSVYTRPWHVPHGNTVKLRLQIALRQPVKFYEDSWVM
ncbi:hypothetical protein FALCPG4_000938 [Fusarium falciforme]